MDRFRSEPHESLSYDSFWDLMSERPEGNTTQHMMYTTSKKYSDDADGSLHKDIFKAIFWSLFIHSEF